MLPCVWFSNRSQKTPKCGKNISDTLGYASCATFLFLPHLDVICDLLLNRRTATWNLFVKYMLTKIDFVKIVQSITRVFLIKLQSPVPFILHVHVDKNARQCVMFFYALGTPRRGGTKFSSFKTTGTSSPRLGRTTGWLHVTHIWRSGIM